MPPNTILVVEDDDRSRRVLQFLLRAAGYETQAASTVREAFARLEGQKAVILDLMLPDGDGADVLAHLRQSGCHTPVAIVTGAARAVRIEGRDILIEKPVTHEKFMALLGWLKQFDDLH